MEKKPNPTRILDVAAQLFAERGYGNVSIRDVCKDAGTTPPMIYYYFRDKKGLFEAAVSHKISMRDFISMLREKAGQKEDERKGIRTFIEIYLSSFPSRAFDPGLYLRETGKLEEESADLISRQLDEVHAIAVSIVERGIARGRFRRTDAGKAADCLIGMINRVVFQRIHFSKSRDPKESLDFIADFFLRAMK